MDNLEELKYTELRNLAKSLGLKAKGKADKLIRDIRRYHKDDGKSISPERKPDEPVSPEDETVFSLNSFFQEADEGELTEQYVDDEIVFMMNPVDQDEENSKCNNSAELENIEETLSKIDDHNETVEFEKHQATKAEVAGNDDEVKEQLNTTFEIEKDKDEQGNEALGEKVDNVQDLLEVMRPEMTDEEMKAELMAAIDKKVQNRKVTIMSPNAASEFVSRIPTLSTVNKSQTKEEKAALKGKDWQKIHEKLFSKQDPLDVYLEKKNKRMQKMNTPLKSAKRIAAESQKAAEKIKMRKETRSTAKPSTQKISNQSFIPKIVSTKSMSLQFTTTSSTVNSVTKSTRTPVSSTKQNKNKNKIAKSTKKSPVKSLSDSIKKTLKRSPKTSPPKSPLVKKPFTPFNFGNKSLTLTPDSAKCKFDLQASLAKPITWKKHTGKLRPMAFGNVGPQYFKKGLNTSIQTNRENRRADTARCRATKRDNLLNSRRNIKL